MISDTNMIFFLNNAIDRARCFLERSQWPGGFWIDFELAVGKSSQWITAYVAQSLATVGSSTAALQQARAWLLRTQLDHGGWGFNRHVPPDADTIGNVLLFLVKFNRTDISLLHAIAKMLNTFQVIQDGGFKTYRSRPPRPGEERAEYLYDGSNWCISHLSVTALAAETLISINRTKYSRVVQPAAEFIRERQSSQGYWNCHWWYGPMYGTYRAARALALFGDETGPRQAANWVAGASHNCGGWGNSLGGLPAPFFTALGTGTLLLCHTEKAFQPYINRGITWLIDVQLEDGSWESTPMLLTPIPQVKIPWEETDPSCSAAVADQNRLFTTATVLSTLAAYRNLVSY